MEPRPRIPRSTGALFRDRRGRIRSGWTFGAWFLALVLVFTPVFALDVGGSSRPVRDAVLALLAAGVSLGAWRVFERRSPGETWLRLDRAALRDAGIGLAAGVGLVGLALLPVAATGAYEVLPRACRASEQVGFLLGTGLLLVAAAAIEEILFRGYPLFAFSRGPGRVAAVLLTSGLFALLHAANPHFGWAPAAALFGIGAVLAVSVLQRESLAEAFGAHLGWNAGLVFLAALPVSGLALPSPCWVGILAGPRWWTGGGFGLEASVPAAFAWGTAAVGLWIRGRRRRPD